MADGEDPSITTSLREVVEEERGVHAEYGDRITEAKNDGALSILEVKHENRDVDTAPSPDEKGNTESTDALVYHLIGETSEKVGSNMASGTGIAPAAPTPTLPTTHSSGHTLKS